jgi:hypothetical protein
MITEITNRSVDLENFADAVYSIVLRGDKNVTARCIVPHQDDREKLPIVLAGKQMIPEKTEFDHSKNLVTMIFGNGKNVENIEMNQYDDYSVSQTNSQKITCCGLS